MDDPLLVELGERDSAEVAAVVPILEDDEWLLTVVVTLAGSLLCARVVFVGGRAEDGISVSEPPIWISTSSIATTPHSFPFSSPLKMIFDQERKHKQTSNT